MVQENEACTSRGEPDDLSQQNIDRFWGAALAAGIPLLVENLPAITKEVGVAIGGALGKGGFFSGLFGREYRARADEQKHAVRFQMYREQVAGAARLVITSGRAHAGVLLPAIAIRLSGEDSGSTMRRYERATAAAS